MRLLNTFSENRTRFLVPVLPSNTLAGPAIFEFAYEIHNGFTKVVYENAENNKYLAIDSQFAAIETDKQPLIYASSRKYWLKSLC